MKSKRLTRTELDEGRLYFESIDTISLYHFMKVANEVERLWAQVERLKVRIEEQEGDIADLEDEIEHYQNAEDERW